MAFTYQRAHMLEEALTLYQELEELFNELNKSKHKTSSTPRGTFNPNGNSSAVSQTNATISTGDTANSTQQLDINENSNDTATNSVAEVPARITSHSAPLHRARSKSQSVIDTTESYGEKAEMRRAFSKVDQIKISSVRSLSSSAPAGSSTSQLPSMDHFGGQPGEDR